MWAAVDAKYEDRLRAIRALGLGAALRALAHLRCSVRTCCPAGRAIARCGWPFRRCCQDRRVGCTWHGPSPGGLSAPLPHTAGITSSGHAFTHRSRRAGLFVAPTMQPWSSWLLLAIALVLHRAMEAFFAAENFADLRMQRHGHLALMVDRGGCCACAPRAMAHSRVGASLRALVAMPGASVQRRLAHLHCIPLPLEQVLQVCGFGHDEVERLGSVLCSTRWCRTALGRRCESRASAKFVAGRCPLAVAGIGTGCQALRPGYWRMTPSGRDVARSLSHEGSCGPACTRPWSASPVWRAASRRAPPGGQARRLSRDRRRSRSPSFGASSEFVFCVRPSCRVCRLAPRSSGGAHRGQLNRSATNKMYGSNLCIALMCGFVILSRLVLIALFRSRVRLFVPRFPAACCVSFPKAAALYSTLALRQRVAPGSDLVTPTPTRPQTPEQEMSCLHARE